MPQRLLDKVALITAAADGIGRATATRFVEEGAQVVVTDINEEGVMEVARDLGAIGLRQDAGEEADWEGVMAATRERFGKLDVLVNNAGIGGSPGDIERQSVDDYHNVLRVNVDSTFIGSKLAIRLMKAQGGGAIVNVSSVHGIKAAPYEAAYSAAKGAIRLLTKSIAAHCAHAGYGIRCNSIHPGYVLTTQMVKWINDQPDAEQLLAQLTSDHPIGFLGEPADIANGVLFLASDESRYMTGAELVMDGGYML